MPRSFGLAAVLISLTACGETLSAPNPLDSDLLTAAAQGWGQPVVTRTVVDETFVIPAPFACPFDLQIHQVGQSVDQEWFDGSGQLRLRREHQNFDNTFTNLDTGLSATNNSNQNVATHWDANGNMTRQAFNGSPQKIHEYQGSNNRLRFYIIGHRVITYDPSTGQVTSEVFRGRSNEATQTGPCDALS